MLAPLCLVVLGCVVVCDVSGFRARSVLKDDFAVQLRLRKCRCCVLLLEIVAVL